MSRSKKKNPFTTICGGSNKADKSIANRKFRRLSSRMIHNQDFENLPVDLDEISDTWDFSTDGLAFYYDKDETLLRK